MTTKTLLKHSILLVIVVSFSLSAQIKTIDQRVDSILKLMTIKEKIGQLNQYSVSWATGPVSPEGDKLAEVKSGDLGSVLNIKGVKKVREIQSLAMQSRLKIPVLFGLDIIHGYKTTFPIPLAEAATWDLKAIEQAARIAAIEGAASGINWTFAPMVDIARDPRWGRVMEGAGEDTYLGSLIAKARVRGFQGKLIGDLDAILACAKHFAAYGAAVGGRDYNSVDMSERMLWETYLPPFKAALDAGAATFMNSFNDLNGIPATGSSYLQRDILKGLWKFDGFVVSDWGSIGEMIPHGFAKDSYDAARLALNAGSDMDMESRAYKNNIEQLLKDGKIIIELVDDAVRRILKKKFDLGLFDDPYKFCNEERETKALNNPEHKTFAREIAEKSIVLLKNDKDILPLKKGQKIALIGPLAKSKNDMLGSWNVEWPDNSDVISQFEGLDSRIGKDLLYSKGCEVSDTSRSGFAEAVSIAKQADIVVISVGELRNMSGEAASRSNIHLPGVQEELIKAVHATGKPIVVLINAGRPLIFNWTADNVNSILYTWWLGSEAGNAIANVLFGNYNPSGKLPMTFPRAEGQIPIYYNYYNTGRPAPDNDSHAAYRSAYIDLQKSPKYPFGFGLSYTTFKYSDLKINKNQITRNETIEVSFTLTNTGKVEGEEVVQLYLRDQFGSVVRPMKELKDFQKIALKPGESKTINFTIDRQKLCFYNSKLEWIAEPGMFDLMIGSSAADIKLNSSFELL